MLAFHHLKFSSPAFAFLACLATAASAPPLAAQDFSKDAVSKANPYKDLPGVTAPQKDQPNDQDEAECEQDIETRNFRRHDDFGFGGSAIVYRCKKNGIIVESERPPLRKNWNPLDLK